MYKGENMEPSWLPPGFRFYPTDEELINYYLTKKVLNSSFSVRAIVDVDVNQCEPWDFRGKAKLGEKEWYFFTLRDRKYPTGTRANRATEAGYWKATGKDREIISSQSGCLIGMKKTLVFYRGRAPKGEKTNWVMHEYRLEGTASLLQYTKDEANKAEWVVCRIFQKKIGATKSYLKDIIQDNLSNISKGLFVLPPSNEYANQTAVEGDTDSIIQGDHVSGFSEDNDCLRFPSKGHQYYALDWYKGHKSVNNLDSASRLCESNNSSCLDKHTSNLRDENASSSSDALQKLIKAPAQHVGSDQPYSPTCKVEHHADCSENFQNHYRLLDKSPWLQGSMPYEDSQSLLDAKLPSVSPLNMESFSEEVSPSLYTAVASSTDQDFDCLLAC